MIRGSARFLSLTGALAFPLALSSLLALSTTGCREEVATTEEILPSVSAVEVVAVDLDEEIRASGDLRARFQQRQRQGPQARANFKNGISRLNARIADDTPDRAGVVHEILPPHFRRTDAQCCSEFANIDGA